MNAAAIKTVSADGWLNRALQKAPAAYAAVSIGPAQPLILRGAAQNTSSWSPAILPEASDDTLDRLLDLYENDAVLKASLSAALGADTVAGGMDKDGHGMGRRPRRSGAIRAAAQAAGKFLAQPDGPEIAVVSLEGWDTHTGRTTRCSSASPRSTPA